MGKIMAGEIGPVEKITKFGETWYIQEFYRPDGNLEAVALYNCFGEFETEQTDRDALEEWFLDLADMGEYLRRAWQARF